MDNRIKFDLEQCILSLWKVTDDIDVLLEYVIEDDTLTKDKISNILLGLHGLYQIKGDKAFRTFESFCKAFDDKNARIKRLEEQLESVTENLRDYQEREYSGLGEWVNYGKDDTNRN